MGTVHINDNDFGGATMPMWWSKGGLLRWAVVFYGRRAVKFMPHGHDGRVKRQCCFRVESMAYSMVEVSSAKWFRPRLARLVPFLSRFRPNCNLSSVMIRVLFARTQYVYVFFRLFEVLFVSFLSNSFCALPLLKENKINNGLFSQKFEGAGTQNIWRSFNLHHVFLKKKKLHHVKQLDN